MKFKPKEVLVNLPTVLTFTSEDEIVQMASAFNSFVHGKVKMKYEVLGILGGQHVGLFYIQRNNESQQLRDEFIEAINQDEELNYSTKVSQITLEKDENTEAIVNMQNEGGDVSGNTNTNNGST